MTIRVIGLGIDPVALPTPYADIIAGADVLVGGKRQLAQSAHLVKRPVRTIPIAAPLHTVFAAVADEVDTGHGVVVLADGDPLFFGIGARLVAEFGPEAVRVYPNVTAMQTAAARIGVPWQGIPVVSLHGRDDYAPLRHALYEHNLVAVLTDDRNTPGTISRFLLERGADWFAMHVFESLGAPEERVTRHSLSEAASREFSSLNLILLERTGVPERQLALGTEETAYETDNGLITKWPVRAAGIAALQLTPDSVLWDLGAGCGSVGLEACAIVRRGTVYAVERDAARVEMIRKNRRRFGALSLEVVHGTLPDCLAGLPDPDRVFIGGGLGKNADLLDVVLPRLEAVSARDEQQAATGRAGRLVVHCVLLGTLERVRSRLEKAGWRYDITMLQASVSGPLGGDVRLEARNPVFIVAASPCMTTTTGTGRR